MCLEFQMLISYSMNLINPPLAREHQPDHSLYLRWSYLRQDLPRLEFVLVFLLPHQVLLLLHLRIVLLLRFRLLLLRRRIRLLRIII